LDTNPLGPLGSTLNYGPYEILVNMVLALALGLLVATVYRATHKGLSYSQSFTLTIVFVSLVVAVVMMVIGSSLARAFALVGALSIIRFRTVVKDTKDTAYVFFGLALGMAAGTSNYFLAIAGGLFITAVALVLHKLNYGALYKSEFIVRFSFDQKHGSEAYLQVIEQHAKRSNLLHIEPSGDGAILSLTYDIVLREGVDAKQFAARIGEIEGVSEVAVIASKSDVDY
jgi:hypothetical protein